ncbi:MAG: hypothetical protein CMP08_01005 [Xanthomonadales bacterium]|mgnify:FL=1|nr:hypothetical protein [Xanthomonadales bacterium]|tara:strand:- start:757 stop:1332 length:576 start_codon:yes stop_codon:yes gene_type:complete
MPDATDNTPQSALLGHIADQLRRLRASRGLSASALARQAGIAKSTLTQLELGRGNPGIETLWALASTLGVPFAELITAAPADVAIVRAGQGTTTENEQATMQATLIDTAWSGRRQSLYRLHLAARAIHVSQPHLPATIEHLYVISGQLSAGPQDQPVLLAPGDYMRYAGDGAHIYRAYETDAEALLIMAYD